MDRPNGTETSGSRDAIAGIELAQLLRDNASEIVTEWSRVLKRGTMAGYSSAPIDEIEFACAECLRSLAATLADGDHSKMRRFVHREVRTRLRQGYHQSEIDQLFCSFRLASWPLIAGRYAGDTQSFLTALMRLQQCVDEALCELADFYEATALELAEESLAEMEAKNRKLEEISVRDSLTGLYNRRYFQDRLSDEFHRAHRHSRPVSLLMVDVDHFKNVNDTYGHQTGDEVLRSLGLMLVNRTRTIDVVARYGGEEFVALLPETDGPGALEVAERLRELVALTPLHRVGPNTGIKAGEPETIHCTVSIGVACLAGTNMIEPGHLLGAADTALYSAKASGRNRVVASWKLTTQNGDSGGELRATSTPASIMSSQ
jgi:diguanylate cyclase (GGDEF)-like protein